MNLLASSAKLLLKPLKLKDANMIDTGWKKEMDKLCEETAKNWWNTGNCKKPNYTDAFFDLGEGKKKPSHND